MIYLEGFSLFKVSKKIDETDLEVIRSMLQDISDERPDLPFAYEVSVENRKNRFKIDIPTIVIFMGIIGSNPSNISSLGKSDEFKNFEKLLSKKYIIKHDGGESSFQKYGLKKLLLTYK